MASFHSLDRIHFNGTTVFLDVPTSLSPADRSLCLAFVDSLAHAPYLDRSAALRSIPLTSEPSSAPLSILLSLLVCFPGDWPTFDLQCTYARLWRHLPESTKAGRPSAELELVKHADQLVTCSAPNLLSLFPSTQAAAILDPVSGTFLSHSALSSFIQDFRLPTHCMIQQNIAVALPNGPILGLALFATTAYYTVCPLSVASGAEQFKSDLVQSLAKVVLVTQNDVSRLGLDQDWVVDEQIEVLIVKPEADLTFTLAPLTSSSIPVHQPMQPKLNGPDDIALMLFTSGTSGTKKTVPFRVSSLIAGIAFVIDSWGLKDSDVCLNMMPLFHVGGIVRNLFAPVMAGGSTICCSAFDANSFWDIIEDHSPTWYYASPTMHQMILEAATHRKEALAKSQLRLICNAAGGLLPSLANNLQGAFGCSVLPSYGMTECMPISSPPLDYNLDRPGTSGITVGPDLGILDANGRLVRKSGTIGNIAVRGAPLFGGYLKANGKTDRSEFTSDGWFNSGDMGYLDEDGYLFVTGRSKEVINRGGELISPSEVEEAVLLASQQTDSPIEGRISAVLAFSMPHNVLQETVGLVVVTPAEKLRPSLKTVQEAVSQSLSPVKWPQVLVFMNDLPKNNNKVLRIRLGQRMRLPDLTDDMLLADRHWEATCPAPNTALSENIETTAYLADLDHSARTLFKHIGPDYDVFVKASDTDGLPEAYLAPPPDADASFDYPPEFDALSLLAGQLDDLHMPTRVHLLDSPLPTDETGDIDHEALDEMTTSALNTVLADSDFTTGELKVATAFATILSCPISSLRKDSDFFALGGDSLRAGRLLSELRKESNARIPVDALFTSGQIGSLAGLIEQSSPKKGISVQAREIKVDDEPIIGRTCNSTNLFLLLLQLIPMVVIYPMKRALTWTIFMYMLSESQYWHISNWIPGRVLCLIISLAVGRLVTFTVSPLFGIAVKWLLIGRYRTGLFPMWGGYHTRWWLVQKILSVSGKGHFALSNTGLVWYYRLLGAKIGKNVTIAKSALLGEYDLLEIGDHANLDRCICRGFAVEKNAAMFLGRVKIGKNASVGLNSIVAPGTVVPDGICIGPNSSSWELKDADESHRNLSASKVLAISFLLELLLCYPIAAFVNIIRAGPWVAGLTNLVLLKTSDSEDKVLAVILWFAEPYRIGFHYLAIILHAYVGPMTWFLAVCAVKLFFDVVIGKQDSRPVSLMSFVYRFKMALMKHIVPLSRLHDLIELFGAHYEVTSYIYRMLGAKVGKRVYWPGTGPAVQDFDLLNIGDDVVFGSRSHIITSDGNGSTAVEIGDGAMISDRVVLLPGTKVGEQTVFGSGALSRRDKAYQPATVWVGSRGGEAVCLSDGRSRRQPSTAQDHNFGEKFTWTETTQELKATEFELESGKTSPNGVISRSMSVFSTATTVSPSQPQQNVSSSPFGRAFYQGLAPYFVFGQPIIFFYSSLTTIFTVFFWNVGTTTSTQIVARVLPWLGDYIDPTSLARPFAIFALFTLSIAVLQTALALVALGTTIAAKWLLLGRRRPGNYNWDKSPYCQRWQLYLTIERLRRHCYGGHGILGLLTGTHYMVLYFRLLGARIGKDVALFAGGNPSCLLTEPDLLTIGDRVAIDDASLVGHINSRGVFDLNELHVGKGSVLRSGSRLLSGAKMGEGAVLMEHTLVMAGDEVESGTTRQGWPSEEFEGLRMPGLPVDLA